LCGEKRGGVDDEVGLAREEGRDVVGAEGEGDGEVGLRLSVKIDDQIEAVRGFEGRVAEEREREGEAGEEEEEEWGEEGRSSWLDVDDDGVRSVLTMPMAS